MNYFITQFYKPNGKFGKFLGKMMSVFNKKMHKAVLSQIREASTILEIGYGAGTQLELIIKKYPKSQLYGIDISKDMYELAIKKIGKHAKLYVCNCEKTPFPDSCFDVIVTTDTCYFWDNPQKVLEEVKRILKSNGRLCIAYNSIYASAVHSSNSNCKLYDNKSILETLKSYGFRVILQKKCGFKQTLFITEFC